MEKPHYDLVVVGAGAGGIAAALAASRMGARTLLLEKESQIGGTMVASGVSCWEASASGTGIAGELYHRMAAIPGATQIYPATSPAPRYEDTLRCHDLAGTFQDPHYPYEDFIPGRYGVIFEPEVLARTARLALEETGCCSIIVDADIVDASGASKAAAEIVYRTPDGERRASADAFIDSSGDAILCQRLGCEMMRGADARKAFDEPDAPDLPAPDELNGVSLIYRVTRNRALWLAPPDDIPDSCWWRDRFPSPWMRQFPNGEWSVNMLPSMTGMEFSAMPYERAYEECLRRVWTHWRHTRKTRPLFADFDIMWTAPRLGMREGSRVVGEYILKEQDVLGGLTEQDHDDIIGIADHPLDIHGARRARSGLLHEPYGIPFRCLIPEGWANLLVACRGASFSHIAASSCRLARTMMQIGQAAGTSVGLALKEKCLPREVSPERIQESLISQGVVLDRAAGRTAPPRQ